MSSIRSDYDLMSNLYKELSTDPFFEFGIIVAGVHNSIFHGITKKHIINDNLNIISSVQNFEEKDGYIDQVVSGAKLLHSISETLDKHRPDLILVVGDREDALMLAIASTYLRIPFIHFYGGDHAEDGHVDNQVRHAISKLASFHFVSTEEHKERLLCLGEEEERITIVGSLSLDNFVNEPKIPREVLFKKLFSDSANKEDKIALVIYHPLVEEVDTFISVIDALIERMKIANLKIVVGQSNNDPSFSTVDKYFREKSSKGDVFQIESLARSDFINLFRNIEVLIGNSSAGILEAATLGIPVINLGRRQKNRTANENVLFSKLDDEEFSEYLTIALSESFRKKTSGVQNIYGDGKSTAVVISELKKISISKIPSKSVDPMSQRNRGNN